MRPSFRSGASVSRSLGVGPAGRDLGTLNAEPNQRTIEENSGPACDAFYRDLAASGLVVEQRCSCFASVRKSVSTWGDRLRG